MSLHRFRACFYACLSASTMLFAGCAGDLGGGYTSVSTQAGTASSSNGTTPAGSDDGGSGASDPSLNSNLPIVDNPSLPGKVPAGSIWIKPSYEVLFASEQPNATDVIMGQLGSSAFATYLAAVAEADPAFISEHITAIGQTKLQRIVYSVDLWDPNQKQQTLNVDDLLLANSSRQLYDGIALSGTGYKIIWPALYTKTLALAFGGYFTTSSGTTNPNFDNGLPFITGRQEKSITWTDSSAATYDAQIQTYLNGFNSGLPVLAQSYDVLGGAATTTTGSRYVVTAGQKFVCIDTTGNASSSTMTICVQVGTTYYVAKYDSSKKIVTVRNITQTASGTAYDNLYGIQTQDGNSVTMSLGIFKQEFVKLRTLQ